MYDAETWDTLESRSEIPEKFLSMVLEKFSWTDRARNEEVLHKTKDGKHILRTAKSRVAN